LYDEGGASGAVVAAEAVAVEQEDVTVLAAGDKQLRVT
jgi:hypothetical protein